MELELFPVEKIDHLVQPDEFNDITPQSPALSIFTDFKRHTPHVIDANVPALNAEKMMLKAHVKLQLVVDKSMEFVGTVSLNDLSPQNILKKTNLGIAREDVRVADLMRSRLLLKGLSFKNLKKATVADVVDTLRNNGQQHCLIIDTDHHHIRGLISASDIARRLHIPIVINASPSFNDVFRHLANPA